MDVGLIVNLSGLIAAAFALLAGMALAVELGVAPKKNPGKSNSKKNEDGAHKSTGSSPRGSSSPDRNSTDNGNDQTQERLLGTNQPPESGPVEALAAKQNSSAESITNLQRTYVDGLLGPRKKYDVALAILNEYEATAVSEEDAALLVATQAYLSATRTGSLSSGAFSLGGIGAGDKTSSKKQTKEIDAPLGKNTQETDTTPSRMTGERSRPPSRRGFGGRDGASKKTTTGDQSEPSEQNRSTARNTKRKNTRPE